MKFKPLADRVVVKRAKTETKTVGGIIIPDTATEKPQEGVIAAVGPGAYVNGKLEPIDAEVGDRILFGKWSGDDIKIEGEDYLIIRAADIIGKLR